MARPRNWIGRNLYDGDYVWMTGSRKSVISKRMHSYELHDQATQSFEAGWFERAYPSLRLECGQVTEVRLTRVGDVIQPKGTIGPKRRSRSRVCARTRGVA